MKRTFKLSSLSSAIALAAALSGYSQETTPAQPGERLPDAHPSPAYTDSTSSKASIDTPAQIKNGVPERINKARDLIGMQIRNQQDQKLGKVKDVVLDLQSGRVAYVVLSTGGLRPKFLALPPSVLTASGDEKYLLLKADKDRVMAASGFNKDAWPNMATPSWGGEPFWQTPEGKSYETPAYDKNPDLNQDRSTDKDKVQEPSAKPAPTPPDQINK
jgi:sporulation protein YlmC with PRC-barrel domain